MKKLIYGMSFNRQPAKSKMLDYSEELTNHILKCLIYHAVKPENINGWIKEISNWLVAVSRIKVKKGKLKPSDYKETIFSYFGTDKNDALVAAESFQFNFTGDHCKNPYPDFEITDELVNEIYEVFKDISSTFIPMFMKKGTLDLWDVEDTLYDILGI